MAAYRSLGSCLVVLPPYQAMTSQVVHMKYPAEALYARGEGLKSKPFTHSLLLSNKQTSSKTQKYK